VRFPSKCSSLTAYEQQRARVGSKSDRKIRLLTHDGHINPTLIPTRHSGNKLDEISLHNVFVACELLKGKDTWALLPLFRDNLAAFYIDIILNNETVAFQPPDDLIDVLIKVIAESKAKGQPHVTLNTNDLLYFFDFIMTYKVGGISSPYAVID
jgi:hypothetical protein